MSQHRMFLVETSTLTPSMHRQLTIYGRYCMQDNQLLTKSHVELEDTSIVWFLLLTIC